MCDTFVALPGATADGSVILAKNSDREPNEAQVVHVVAALEHPPSETLRATYVSIPQARRTHRVLLAKPYWMWGAEMGVNEHGVAIGNEAVFTKAKHESQPGLLGMDLLRLGLERGATADEAVEVITTHLQQYGQSGQAGHTKPLQYDNSFLIADPQGALVLETVGRDWAIERVTSTRSISNALTIHQRPDSTSPALAEPGLDIAARHSDLLYTRFSDARTRQCRTTDALTARRGAIAPLDAMALLRDHGAQGQLPDFTPATGLTGMTVCAHAGYGPIRSSQSVGAMVAHLRKDNITVWVTGTSATCLSAFKPVWLDGGLPDLGPDPFGIANPATLWWRHEDLHRAVLRDYAVRAPRVRATVADLEAQFTTWASDCGPEPRARAEVSAHCFTAADEQLSALLPQVAQQTARRRLPRLYAAAWRRWDREAHRWA